jgi:hypothetical protein
MATMRVETLYNEQIKPLPPADRLQLLALMAQDLAHVHHDDADEQRTIEEHLADANYHGGALFRTADEVDAYIRAERDAWEH